MFLLNVILRKDVIAMKNKKLSKAQKRKKQRRLSLLYLIVTSIFVVLVITSFAQLSKTEGNLDEQILEMTEKKMELQASNEEYRKEIERLNTSDYIEQLARDKLGFVHKNEILVAPRE
jgi:cell division protein DivIC